jgi:hypothetical protein
LICIGVWIALCFGIAREHRRLTSEEPSKRVPGSARPVPAV